MRGAQVVDLEVSYGSVGLERERIMSLGNRREARFIWGSRI